MTQREEGTAKQIMERDPVCGMSVDPAKAAATVDYAGKMYYFCAPGCAKRFQQDPEKYLQPTKHVAAPSGLLSPHGASQSAAATNGSAAGKMEQPKDATA